MESPLNVGGRRRGGGVRPSQPYAFIKTRHDKLAIFCLNDITLRVKRVFKKMTQQKYSADKTTDVYIQQYVIVV